MALTINTNVPSLNAQRNLTTSQSSLATSLQRLSSGLRVNSAKDDAAGLAISERMNAQVRGLNQAARNANDGISLAQTAEGALGQIGDNLQRMRELSVQAANGSLSADDRSALQSEVTQLKNEINRVANQTSFNGTALLDGTSGGFTFQVGANANQTIAINSLGDSRSTALGSSTYAEATGAAVAPAGTDDLSAAAGATAGTSLEVGGFTLNGITISGTDMSVGDNTSVTTTEYKEWMSRTVDAINVKASESGVTAQLDDDGAGNLSISLFGTDTVAFAAGTNDGVALGIDGVDGTTIATGLAAASVGFDSIDVGSVAGANKALTMLDGAIDAVNTMRADLGAVQNRFASTIANLQTSSENLSAARGRIMDADFASETANLSRTQILQQAGTAMLAQANSLPQNVLSLLRG
ncbi:flagellin [Aromatoleum petrolei]|uniref:Flagellin n=1 Tax=Aromatoleum petrolei TaxID=76116 RepID=A0ABX1MXP7_9RHOO|nr:flagellin [Aromatoleum petrolei]NMF91333.1 flagellin [Aromatoleum petrolei]QTQ38121.1 Flagellin domain-containing protein [Aromatoleum petrolei]